MDKLVLVDGSSVLSTSFYGNLPRSYYFAKTEEDKAKALEEVMKVSGTEIFTNAVYTMSQTLINLLNRQNPSHLAIAWDIDRNTFRRKLFPGYKANRNETPDALKSQYGLMQRVIDAMGISQFLVEEFEADDILGTLAKRLSPKTPTYILTKDQDSLQLLDENIRVWLVTSKNEEMYKELGLSLAKLGIPLNTFEFTPPYFEHFYGLSDPKQIVDLKALAGDSSDGISGVPGVGDKSALPLLQEFSTIENLYDYLEDMESNEAELKEFIKSLGIKRSPVSYLTKTSDTELVGKEAAFLSKQLATIVTDMEALQEVSLNSLKVNINKTGMLSIFEELEFKSLLKQGEAL